MMRNRLGLAGILAGVVFAVGLVLIFFGPLPGSGPEVTDKDFTDFYNSSGKRSSALLLYFVLVIGCWLMVWLFTELRTRLVASTRNEVANRLAAGGAVMVMAGGAIDLGPASVQINSRNPAFVGVPIAHVLVQAGNLTAIAGLFTFAVAVLLVGLEFRRSPTFPNWLGVLSIVFAILLIGSYVGVTAFLLPIWAVIVGIVGTRTVSPSTEHGVRPEAAPTAVGLQPDRH